MARVRWTGFGAKCGKGKVQPEGNASSHLRGWAQDANLRTSHPEVPASERNGQLQVSAGKGHATQ